MKNEVNKIFALSDCPSDDILKKYHACELTPDEQRAVELHLASCEACSDELEGMIFFSNDTAINKIIKDLRFKIKLKLGTDSKSRTIPIYFRIAAAVLILFVASWVIYFIVNSDNTIQKNDLALNTATETNKNEKINTREKTIQPSEESIILKDPETKAGDQQMLDKMKVQKNNPKQKSQDMLLGTPNVIQEKSGLFAGTKKGEKMLSDGQAETPLGATSGKGAVQQTMVVADIIVKTEEQKPISVNNVAVSGGYIQAETDADKNIIAGNKINSKTDSKNIATERASSDIAANEPTNSNDETKAYVSSVKEKKKNNNVSINRKEEESSKTETDSRTKNQNEGKDNSIATQASARTNNNILSDAMGKYNAGKYGEAILLFQQIINSNVSDSKALYYQGLCYYETDKSIKAITNFETIVNFGNTVFVEDARWFLALSQLKIKNLDAARTTFDEIIVKGGKHKSEAKKKREEIQNK